MSDNNRNSKLILTVCDDKGTSSSVFIPKGSFKRAKSYHTSLELDKKFNKICKIRLEVEDSDSETWHCQEVKFNYALVHIFTQMFFNFIIQNLFIDIHVLGLTIHKWVFNHPMSQQISLISVTLNIKS